MLIHAADLGPFTLCGHDDTSLTTTHGGGITCPNCLNLRSRPELFSSPKPLHLKLRYLHSLGLAVHLTEDRLYVWRWTYGKRRTRAAIFHGNPTYRQLRAWIKNHAQYLFTR